MAALSGVRGPFWEGVWKEGVKKLVFGELPLKTFNRKGDSSEELALWSAAVLGIGAIPQDKKGRKKLFCQALVATIRRIVKRELERLQWLYFDELLDASSRRLMKTLGLPMQEKGEPPLQLYETEGAFAAVEPPPSLSDKIALFEKWLRKPALLWS